LYPLENAALSRRTPTTDIDSSWNAIAFAAANPSASCELIRAEKRSGTTTEGRSELQIVLDFLRHGDVLMANFNFPFRLSIILQPGDKLLQMMRAFHTSSKLGSCIRRNARRLISILLIPGRGDRCCGRCRARGSTPPTRAPRAREPDQVGERERRANAELRAKSGHSPNGLMLSATESAMSSFEITPMISDGRPRPLPFTTTAMAASWRAMR